MSSQPTQSDDLARLRELATTGATGSELSTLRLALMRREFPTMVVQIDIVRADDTAIAVKATIALPNGARHSVIAAADVVADAMWSDQLAMVQAQAIGEALDGLGYTVSGVLGSQPAQQSSTSTSSDDHLPEYSWNAFWQMVHTRKITRDQVDKALGKSVNESTPKEAVAALQSAGLLTSDMG